VASTRCIRSNEALLCSPRSFRSFRRKLPLFQVLARWWSPPSPFTDSHARNLPLGEATAAVNICGGSFSSFSPSVRNANRGNYSPFRSPTYIHMCAMMKGMFSITPYISDTLPNSKLQVPESHHGSQDARNLRNSYVSFDGPPDITGTQKIGHILIT
jgi:hypothetical protein